ncbi:MAG: hypothetical protein RR575_15265 [Acinetobacter sp.]
MIFSTLLKQFQNLSNGSDAFKQLKNHCEAHILNADSDLENSTLFLIYGFAKNYVLLYEDQAVTAEFSAAAKTQLLGYMQQLNNAIETGNKTLIFDTLNQVTAEYMQSSRVF